MLDRCADLCDYGTCTGSMGTTMCLAAIRKIHDHRSAKVQREFRYKLVLSVGAHVTSCVSTARQDLRPEDRSAHGVVLPQTSCGHRERGQKNRWGVQVEAPAPRFTHRAVSETDTRLPPDPSIDVIFMLSKDSRKRIMHFYLFLCGETSCLSAHCLWVIASTHLFLFLLSSFVIFHLCNPKSFVPKATRQQGWCLSGLCMRSPRSNPRMSASKWGILPWKQSSNA